MKGKFILMFCTTSDPVVSFYTSVYLRDVVIKLNRNPIYVIETVRNYAYGYKLNWLGKLLFV